MSHQLNYGRCPRYHNRGTDPYSSAGRLNVPRTPVERIMLGAKLKRLKREADERRALRDAA